MAQINDSTRYVIGVDCGGTKSVALAVDEAGQLLAQSRAAGANPIVDRAADIATRLEQLLEPLACASAPAAMCVGISGAGRAREQELVASALGAMRERTPLLIVPDVEIALRAGSETGIGIALISGTGSVCFGRDHRQRTHRCGGWGYLLGDEGSAVWLVREGMRRSLLAADGRGPLTSLGEAFEAALSVDLPDGLLRWVYSQPADRGRFAALLPVVVGCARSGDEVALQLIEEAASALAELISTTVAELRFEDEYPLILAGGAFLGCEELEHSVRRELLQRGPAPRARIERLDVEPAWGAVHLAQLESQAQRTRTPSIQIE